MFISMNVEKKNMGFRIFLLTALSSTFLHLGHASKCDQEIIAKIIEYWNGYPPGHIIETFFIKCMFIELVKLTNNIKHLLAEIGIRIPVNTRSSGLFSRKYHSTNYDFNSPLARFVRLGNRVASECDFFADGLHQIRKRATYVLSQHT
ncbi:hypothetical protein J6590_050739 [Homalodisca vitripennis]|nr:hypothetical protein J6590_050739 [Homalodisca vitripennis]